MRSFGAGFRVFGEGTSASRRIAMASSGQRAPAVNHQAGRDCKVWWQASSDRSVVTARLTKVKTCSSDGSRFPGCHCTHCDVCRVIGGCSGGDR
mmetsp:Transcript_28131/g.90567  ORF Transcript_28131/g.90567 Transcript_28131/m.90567 type:complete len:94 (-) Transcript_28131:115-396(-)